MPPKLSDDDGRAVDLILDTPARGDFAASVPAGLQARAKAVEQLLALLNAMPDDPPVRDLAAMVMEQIAEVDPDIQLGGELAASEGLGTHLP